MTSTTVLKTAGAALIVCSLAFVAVFTFLAAAFGYPDILDRGAAEVLPRLAAGGVRLRVVWCTALWFLALWFLALGIAYRREGRRLVGHLGMGASLIVAVAALRNMTPAVAVVAQINNITLPLWLLALGILFFRNGR